MSARPEIIKLQVVGLRYYSQGDEDAFFGWLKSLPFVEHVGGSGRILYITVNSDEVDENGLRELLSLFRRYGVELAQLAAFDRDEFAEWFRDAGAYWHKDVFG